MSTRTWIRTATVALVLAWGALANAQVLDPWIEALKRTTPGTVTVLVERMSARSAAIGLTKERVEQHVIDRLQLYGLRSGRAVPGSVSDGSHLYLVITLGQSGASISVAFRRTVEFEARGERIMAYGAAVWDVGGMADLSQPLRADDTDYILGVLDELLVQFLADYLLANPRSTW